ncbi:MAG TPA: twin-arginine translocase TatA/TatE family subunit [Abditibacteriaceae bacterium]|jgi:TatA/E family protein of Tat protein translocase
MPSLGGGEIIVIFVLALVLFGPHRLPELARGIGKGMREIRKVTSEFQNQLSLFTDDDIQAKSRPSKASLPDTPPEREFAYVPPVETAHEDDEIISAGEPTGETEQPEGPAPGKRETSI